MEWSTSRVYITSLTQKRQVLNLVSMKTYTLNTEHIDILLYTIFKPVKATSNVNFIAVEYNNFVSF